MIQTKHCQGIYVILHLEVTATSKYCQEVLNLMLPLYIQSLNLQIFFMFWIHQVPSLATRGLCLLGYAGIDYFHTSSVLHVSQQYNRLKDLPMKIGSENAFKYVLCLHLTPCGHV